MSDSGTEWNFYHPSWYVGTYCILHLLSQGQRGRMQASFAVRGICRLPHLRLCGAQPLLNLCVRHLSRDIGQPTHFTHPELIGEGESWSLPMMTFDTMKSIIVHIILQFYLESIGQSSPSGGQTL